MASSITTQDKTFVETWENIAVSQNAIIKLTPRGDEKQEVINGPVTFMLTTEERIITEDRIRNAKDNPFRNGSFRPVVIPDDLTIEQNPNALSDADIDKILRSSDVAFEEWIASIDSIATLRRMVEVAEDVDTMTIRRLRRLEGRTLEVRGDNQLHYAGKGADELKKFLQAPSPGAPSGGQPGAGGRVVREPDPGRSPGGRSADYR